ncbi:MAG: LytR/AlgR family response regulator transcription factor, partial [Chitinophagaceae bacterium]
MITALIIDDEPSAINTLRLMLERYIPEIADIKTTSDAQQGLDLIITNKPDLLFLDIQMPTMTGFDLLKKLPTINFNIIFTTAHDQYAIEAIRFSALDYLLKPIDADDLRNAFERFVEKRASSLQSESLYKNFMYNLSVENKKDFKLPLPTTQGTFFFKPEEIIRLEGESNYTQFFFVSKSKLLTSRTLKDYEEILVNHGFI